MQILDETPLDTIVTKEAFAKYFDIQPDNIIKYGYHKPEPIFSFYQHGSYLSLTYMNMDIFYVRLDDYGNSGLITYIGYDCLQSNPDILKYFDLPCDVIGNRYRFKVYGETKKLLCPLIKFIEKYRTFDMKKLLFEKLLYTEKINETLTAGLCLTNKIPGELILDVIEKKDEL